MLLGTYLYVLGFYFSFAGRNYEPVGCQVFMICWLYLYASKNLLYIPNSIRTVFLFLTKTLCKCQLLLILSILSSYLVWSSLHYEITTIIMSILQSVKLRFRVFGSQPCPESQRRTWWSGVWAQEAELDPRVLALSRCLLPPWPSRWGSCIIYPDHTYTPSLIYTGKN